MFAVALCRCFFNINLIDSAMEPIFAKSASETVTAELRAQLDAAVAALPPAHHLNPTENEQSESRQAAYTRL
jgi:hypothetical protein